MKPAGFLMLAAGWAIVLTAIALLPQASARAAFVLAGVGVEMVGLVVAARSHRPARRHRG